MPSPQQITEALWERSHAQAKTIDFATLHLKQRAFAEDASPYRVALCSRGAGKTYVCPRLLFDSAQKRPGSVQLYITKTLTRAKQLMWGPLLRLNSELGLGGLENGQTSSIQMPNGSRVQLAGANTRAEIDKLRGDAYGIAIMDEAQTFPSYLSDLVDNVIGPRLSDHGGVIVLIGTPPPVPVGYFHDASQSPEWSRHHWTIWDNPFVPSKLERGRGLTTRAIFERELKRRGLTEDAPSIRREWFGEEAVDLDALVLHWNVELNAAPETLPTMRGHVIGIDLGWEDADAIVVLGWADQPELYLLEERVMPRQTNAVLAREIKVLQERYQPLATVVDQGGLGKKIAESLMIENRVNLEAAEKERKFEFLALLDDMLRSGRLKAKTDSRFATDCMLLEWDRDKSNADKRVIRDSYHSDVIDAVLYAYRRALHWLPAEPKKEPMPAYGTPEWHTRNQQQTQQWLQDQEAREEETIRQRKQEREDYGGLMDDRIWGSE